jgi:CrcB protein
MASFLWVCLGGGLGSGARYLVGLGLAPWGQGGFPWGTFVVNALGSFFLALIVTWALSGGQISNGLRLALTTGFMGGFTTYSTFSHEVFSHFEKGQWGVGTLYLLSTVVICLAGTGLGFVAGRALA